MDLESYKNDVLTEKSIVDSLTFYVLFLPVIYVYCDRFPNQKLDHVVRQRVMNYLTCEFIFNQGIIKV